MLPSVQQRRPGRRFTREFSDLKMSHAGSAMASCASASVDDDSKEGTAFGFSHRKADFLKQNE